MFKDIPGYEGLYAVSNKGEVLSYPKKGHKKEPIVLKPRRHSRGYLRVQLSKDKAKKDYYIHRLVAVVFIDNPHGYDQINHKDLDKQNNNVANLEWCDGFYNQKHAYDNGVRDLSHMQKMSKKGAYKKRKLSFGQAEEIRSLYYSGEKSYSELQKIYSISDGCLYGILKRVTYKN